MTISKSTQRPWIMLDGSHGEGGGQILRTALGLSALTGRSFSIENIRAGRKKPGLMRQHLTSVNAAAAICSGEVIGAEIGSKTLSFKPGKVMPGAYTFSVGSAGSSTLVLQTILPALLTAGGESTITLEGGTHNPFAPPVDFLEHSFLPVIRRMGAAIDVTFGRHGFYPAGGGRWAVHISPTENLTPITLNNRGEVRSRQAKAVIAGLPGAIALRELERIESRLGWSGDELSIRHVPADEGPGNVLMLKVECEAITEVVTAFAAKGVPAMNVADDAIDQCRKYLGATAPVGEHLADQLLIPFAMAGSGEFIAIGMTPHVLSNIEVIHRFLDINITVDNRAGNVAYSIEHK